MNSENIDTERRNQRLSKAELIWNNLKEKYSQFDLYDTSVLSQLIEDDTIPSEDKDILSLVHTKLQEEYVSKKRLSMLMKMFGLVAIISLISILYILLFKS